MVLMKNRENHSSKVNFSDLELFSSLIKSQNLNKKHIHWTDFKLSNLDNSMKFINPPVIILSGDYRLWELFFMHDRVVD